MKKLAVIFIIMALAILSVPNVVFAADAKSDTHTIEYVSKDSYVIRSELTFPKTKAANYPLVVLLHSYGLSSKFWDGLPKKLNNAGYAVLAIDFRGHGQSIYLTNLKQRSYMYLSKETFQQFPNDVYNIVNKVYDTYSSVSKNETFFIGADIGANTAIYVADMLKKKPAALVLITPQVDFKGLYTPIKLAEAGVVPVLAIASAKDAYSLSQINDLKKYAQGVVSLLRLPAGGPGMTTIATNSSAMDTIINWLVQQTTSTVKSSLQ